jgi:rubrerythrin
MNVFDFAMEVERSGSNFYRNLARRAASPGVRTIFSMMAKDEEQMLGRLQAMRAATQTTTLEDSRALEYVDNIFRHGLDEGEALRIDDDLGAYHYVIKVEEAICRLYEEAAGREPDPEVRGLLRRVADEEHRELDSLQRVYDFVNAPNEYLAWGEFSNPDEFRNFGRDVD